MGNLQFSIKQPKDFNVGIWSGGTTTQMAIYPENAQYQERNFIWRISSATVELEESDFTSLPAFDRILMVLEGEAIIVHKGFRTIRLHSFEQDRFSGANETKIYNITPNSQSEFNQQKQDVIYAERTAASLRGELSYGKITDFNLMVRKGSQGFVESILLTEQATTLETKATASWEKISQSFYCVEGYCVAEFAGESIMIRQGELLNVNYDKQVNVTFSVMGQGRMIRTQVYFNVDVSETETAQYEDLGIEAPPLSLRDKPKEAASFEDLLAAAKICYTNFRGSQFLFKSMKKIWYDEELQKGIDKIERVFLPFLICLVGMCVLGFGAFQLWGSKYIAQIIVIWVIVDFFVVNPLLYFAMLPKPVAAHIKRLDALTEQERNLYEKQKTENKKIDKLLKKYEISGRNKYIE